MTVSAIGLGCMGFGHDYGPDRKESIKLFRKRVIFTTKLHIPDDCGDLEKDVRAHLEASLRRLVVDSIGLYCQHYINKRTLVEEMAGVSGKLIDEGKIRGRGQSQTIEEELRCTQTVTPITAIQREYSMMECMFEKDVLPACRELGIWFVPFSPLGTGFLSGQYPRLDTYTGDNVRRVIARFSKENMNANQSLLDLLQEVAAAKQSAPAQVALVWMLHKWDRFVAIPGMRKAARMLENFGVVVLELTDGEFAAFEQALACITIYGNRTDEDIAKLKNMI